MNAADCIAALELPDSARVDQRIPKKTLSENIAKTAASRRQIQEGIEEIRWVAALKPTTIGVREFVDDVREYLEIAILHLQMRSTAKPERLTELTHRAIPYPVLLVSSFSGHVALSFAHKRWSQGEKGKVVLDGEIFEAQLSQNLPGEQLEAFRLTLSLARQPRKSLYALYQGWMDTALALSIATTVGTFTLSQSVRHAAQRREALANCVQLEKEMTALRAAASREKQVPRQVELNLQLKRLSEAYVVARAQL
jgi:uncharacterized protein DUF4391